MITAFTYAAVWGLSYVVGGVGGYVARAVADDIDSEAVIKLQADLKKMHEAMFDYIGLNDNIALAFPSQAK